MRVNPCGRVISRCQLRRPPLQLVSALGTLIALAIFDLGPRAAAAFQTMSAKPASVGLSAADDFNSQPNPDSDRERDGLPTPGVQLQGGGGTMTPSGSGPYSGSVPVAGDLSRTELPSDGLVVYYREPPASLDLSAFIDSILDPPRQA
jgi:hypothetical protein